MAYADLATIQDTDPGDVLTAAWCDQVRDNDEFMIDPPACSIYAFSSQSVADATLVELTADSENFDNAAMHSTSVNTARITIPVSGRYLLVSTAIFDANATGERNVQWLVNGATAIQGQKIDANSSGSQTTVVTATRAYVFSAGDYVTTRVRHRNTGGALNVTLDEFFAYFITR